jgi:hypothetical protein
MIPGQRGSQILARAHGGFLHALFILWIKSQTPNLQITKKSQHGNLICHWLLELLWHLDLCYLGFSTHRLRYRRAKIRRGARPPRRVLSVPRASLHLGACSCGRLSHGARIPAAPIFWPAVCAPGLAPAPISCLPPQPHACRARHPRTPGISPAALPCGWPRAETCPARVFRAPHPPG